MNILRLIFLDLPSKTKIYLSAWLLVHCLLLNLSNGDDSLSSNQSLSGDQTLVSSGEVFELGFFKPGNNSRYYYMGIWYKNISPQTVVWVANRDKPMSDKYSSELKFTEDGNLVLLHESKTQIWSTNVNYTVLKSVIAVLLDDGNFVLKDASDQNSGLPIWQSFDYPTNTFLPGSKISYSKRTKTEHVVTSWKNSEDPATGRFSFEFEPDNRQFVMKVNGSERYWASGQWNEGRFSALPETALRYLYNFSYISNENESSFTFSVYSPSTISRLALDVTGQLQLLTWLQSTQQWNIFWVQPKQLCEVYAVCGAFGTCNPSSSKFCTCPIGFNPRKEGEWNLGDFSGGCARKTDLACQTSSTETSRNVRFVATGWSIRNHSSDQSVETAKYLPVTAREEAECKSACVEDCSCNAYTYLSNVCWIWKAEIFDLVQPSEDDDVANERTVYLKVASSDIPPVPNSRSKKLVTGIISGIAFLVFLSLCSVAFFAYRRRVIRRDHEHRMEREMNSTLRVYERHRGFVHSSDPWKRIKTDQKGIEIPFFEFEAIVAATENFSDANKLGQGGFGPVYKGRLPEGLEIAVKRLSSSSGQGLEEFKNEVMLIAKLQHRNLVRLLGYCMEGEEMILLYEYMPNKSLNHFIFDRTRCGLLDWSKRFDIILGIARGLLYLHQDSRLRIIHRDLKTSNILLDEDLNPKISDFGLAKIVQGTATEASTKRVMGTYGYMSPEYALDGLFSVKSDVFSFGVVVLEIISGKKNNGFYQSQEAPSLLGYAWNLWKEEKPLDLMDEVLVESCNSTDVLKCVNLALLCIQENPNDRPTMSNVVLMLNSNACLPRPKQPAFVARGGPCSTFSPSKVYGPCTQTNCVSTTSILEGR